MPRKKVHPVARVRKKNLIESFESEPERERERARTRFRTRQLFGRGNGKPARGTRAKNNGNDRVRLIGCTNRVLYVIV